jgi:predicted nucleic acid-binding protein
MDSSVLFKCYCQEAGSGRAQELLADRRGVGSAGLSYVEVFSALNRKLRERGIDRLGYATAAEEFERDWVHFTVLPLSGEILLRARQVIERHALRAGDAVQLASALTLAASLPTEFASADDRLSQAARREGLTVL